MYNLIIYADDKQGNQECQEHVYLPRVMVARLQAAVKTQLYQQATRQVTQTLLSTVLGLA